MIRFCSIACLVLLPLLDGAVSSSSAQISDSDSLVSAGDMLRCNGRLDSAQATYRLAIHIDSQSGRAAVGLGWVAALQEQWLTAEEFFALADSVDPDAGHAEFGRGIVLLQQGEKDDAEDWFERVRPSNGHHADALVELALLRRESRVNKLRVVPTLKRAIEANPQHPRAHFLLGQEYAKAQQRDQAIAEYEEQLRVNPSSPEALMALGYAFMKREQWWHARQRLLQALEASNRSYTIELVTAVAATYVRDRQFNIALEFYIQAFTFMPLDEQVYYEDISHVAGVEIAAMFANLTGADRVNFIKRFWLQRDPTPVTAINERLMEHFRRVWYARKHFSRGRDPWDDRGTVYIRYGDPNHRSSSREVNFVRSREVDEIRRRYLYTIYGPAPPESLRDSYLPAFPLVEPSSYDTDDIGAKTFLGDNGADFQWRASRDKGYGAVNADQNPYTHQVYQDPSLVRWEAWTYTHVSNGIELTFVDEMNDGAYDFARPPVTGNISLLSTLQQFSPSAQFNNAQNGSPDRYIYDPSQSPLDFYYYTAQFRSEDGRTDIDVYYGLPIDELVFRQRDEGHVATIKSGVSVFDTLWNVRGRSEHEITLHHPTSAQPGTGTMHLDMRSITIGGDKRILVNVQVEDVASGRLQAYRENIRTSNFSGKNLIMSDIILAGNIYPIEPENARGNFVKNDLQILPTVSRSFEKGDAMYIYFEVYNLTRGPDYGETEYEVEHAIRDSEAGNAILGSVGRILVGRGSSVGIGQIVGGIRTADYQKLKIDTSSLIAGKYDLVVTIRDLKSGQTTERIRSFSIVE
jgi:GWxTD domain-containing protein